MVSPCKLLEGLRTSQNELKGRRRMWLYEGLVELHYAVAGVNLADKASRLTLHSDNLISWDLVSNIL